MRFLRRLSLSAASTPAGSAAHSSTDRLDRTRPLHRSPLALGALVAGVAVGLGAVTHAQRSVAQAPSMRRVQATPPAENTQAWAGDNCLYQFKGGGWRSLDYCRVMVSRTVYDTYKPSTRQWISRIDTSEPGWLAVLALNIRPANWFKIATNGSGRVLVLVNGGWQDATALMSAQASSARPIPGTPGTIGGGYDGGLTKTIELGHVPVDKLDEYIGRRTQGDVNSARIRTSRVCTAYDRIHNVPGCPKI